MTAAFSRHDCILRNEHSDMQALGLRHKIIAWRPRNKPHLETPAETVTDTTASLPVFYSRISWWRQKFTIFSKTGKCRTLSNISNVTRFARDLILTLSTQTSMKHSCDYNFGKMTTRLPSAANDLLKNWRNAIKRSWWLIQVLRSAITFPHSKFLSQSAISLWFSLDEYNYLKISG